MDVIKKRAIVIASCACLLNFSLGTFCGWTSPVMPKLRANSEDSPLKFGVTIAEEGWIGSMLPMGTFICCLLVGPLADKIGRKTILLSSSTVFAASLVLFLIGIEVWIICLGRFLQGAAGSLIATATPIYIGEIAPTEIRGALGALFTVFFNCGILFSYVIGPCVSYISFQWCLLAIPVIFFLIFSFMPESPYYFAMKGQLDDGIKSIQFLRGQSSDQAKIEMMKIQEAVDESMSNRGTLVDIFNNRVYRKALIICCGLLSFQSLTGIAAITVNTQTIFISTDSTIDPAVAAIIISVVQIGSSLLTPLLIERSGRKILLLVSAAGMTLAHFALGLYFYIKTFGDTSKITWLPIPALVCYYAMYGMGFGPVPWAMLGEIFPSNIKSAASHIAICNASVATFLTIRWYGELGALGLYYVFWFFTLMGILAMFVVHFVAIETKGLSLQEIQEKLKGPRTANSDGKAYESVSTKVPEKV